MSKLSVIFLVVIIARPFPAFAYTQQDADACTPDAFRLCQTAIPDVSRVSLCLAQNKRRLSAACTIVFNRPHSASDRERPGNVQKTNY
jgi:hypothetical protein